MDKVRSAVLNWKDKLGGSPAAVAAIKKATGYATTRQTFENFLGGSNPKYELLHGIARAMGHIDTDGLMELRPVGAPRPPEASAVAISVVVGRLGQILAKDLPADVRRDAAYLLQQLAEFGAVERHRAHLIDLLEPFSATEVVPAQQGVGVDLAHVTSQTTAEHAPVAPNEGGAQSSKEKTKWGANSKNSPPIKEVDTTPKTPGKQAVLQDPAAKKPGGRKAK
jgi:hypothetical protein